MLQLHKAKSLLYIHSQAAIKWQPHLSYSHNLKGLCFVLFGGNYGDNW